MASDNETPAQSLPATPQQLSISHETIEACIAHTRQVAHILDSTTDESDDESYAMPGADEDHPDDQDMPRDTRADPAADTDADMRSVQSPR